MPPQGVFGFPKNPTTPYVCSSGAMPLHPLFSAWVFPLQGWFVANQQLCAIQALFPHPVPPDDIIAHTELLRCCLARQIGESIAGSSKACAKLLHAGLLRKWQALYERIKSRL